MIKTSSTESSFNTQVYEIINSPLNVNRAFVEVVKPNVEKQMLEKQTDGWIERTLVKRSKEGKKYIITERSKKNEKRLFVKPDGTVHDHLMFHIDINKHYKNSMYYNKFDFPLFTVMDEAVEYDSQIGYKYPGLYYVETDCYFPIRGNGWYS